MSDSEFQKKLLAADGIDVSDAKMDKIRRAQARGTARMKWAKRAVIGLWVLYTGLYVVGALLINSWRASHVDDAERINLQWRESVITMNLLGLSYAVVIVTVWWLIRYAFFRFRQIQFAITEVQASLERIGRRLDSVDQRMEKKSE